MNRMIAGEPRTCGWNVNVYIYNLFFSAVHLSHFTKSSVVRKWRIRRYKTMCKFSASLNLFCFQFPNGLLPFYNTTLRRHWRFGRRRHCSQLLSTRRAYVRDGTRIFTHTYDTILNFRFFPLRNASSWLLHPCVYNTLFHAIISVGATQLWHYCMPTVVRVFLSYTIPKKHRTNAHNDSRYTHLSHAQQ